MLHTTDHSDWGVCVEPENLQEIFFFNFYYLTIIY